MWSTYEIRDLQETLHLDTIDFRMPKNEVWELVFLALRAQSYMKNEIEYIANTADIDAESKEALFRLLSPINKEFLRVGSKKSSEEPDFSVIAPELTMGQGL